MFFDRFGVDVQKTQDDYLKSIVPDEKIIGFCFVDKYNPAKGFIIATPTKIIARDKNHTQNKIVPIAEIISIYTDDQDSNKKEYYKEKRKMQGEKLIYSFEEAASVVGTERERGTPNLNNVRRANGNIESELWGFAKALAGSAYASYKDMFRTIIIDCKSSNNVRVSGLKRDDANKFFEIINENRCFEALTSFDEPVLKTEICSVSAGGFHTVGLCADGTVVATGNNECGECNVEKWKEGIAVSAGFAHTVGLCEDGTVVATGNVLATGDNEDGRCNVEEWKEVIAVSAGVDHTVGLCADGTVVATGNNICGQCNVEEWKEVIAVSAGDHTVGLCADGTVVATGYNEDGRCNVEEWKEVIAVSAGGGHTVGLCADGTVVATGDNEEGQCNVEEWKEVIAVSAGGFHTVGLCADGTVVATGKNKDGQCNA